MLSQAYMSLGHKKFMSDMKQKQFAYFFQSITT